MSQTRTSPASLKVTVVAMFSLAIGGINQFMVVLSSPTPELLSGDQWEEIWNQAQEKPLAFSVIGEQPIQSPGDGWRRKATLVN